MWFRPFSANIFPLDFSHNVHGLYIYYILSGDTWISGSASHTCSCTFLEARHPVAQFYIHGTVAAILWSDACMQMYSGESCIASHTWQWDDSEPMYAINQSHGTVAAILWKNGPTGDVNAWCMHRWIDRADRLAEAVARMGCLLRVAIYIYIYI